MGINQWHALPRTKQINAKLDHGSYTLEYRAACVHVDWSIIQVPAD